jgi:hypothetical protein
MVLGRRVGPAANAAAPQSFTEGRKNAGRVTPSLREHPALGSDICESDNSGLS